MKFVLLSALCLITLRTGSALANLPIDLDVSYQKISPEHSGWSFLDMTSTSSSSWKHVYLTAGNASSRKMLASLNPALDYCCTMADWTEKSGPTRNTKEITASDLVCRAYPSGGTHSVYHEANSGCRFTPL